jgi:hypothetical protein
MSDKTDTTEAPAEKTNEQLWKEELIMVSLASTSKAQ